eukprot:scaffold10583_cov290-Chaetoceros_neogracile.AAC.25
MKRVRREHDCNDGGNEDTVSRDYPLPMTSGEDNVKLLSRDKGVRPVAQPTENTSCASFRGAGNLSRQIYHKNTDCEQFNATPKSTGSIQDLNHDILSIIYSFIYEPRLDQKRFTVEGDFHISNLFLNIAPVCKDLRQSCIHHAQTVPLILRFKDRYFKNRNNTYFSAVLKWALIVCPKISVIELDVDDFSRAKICMSIIQNCNLACLKSFKIYSPWTPANNESQPDWMHLQNTFVLILRSYTTTPPIHKLDLSCNCGAIDENLLDMVARTVQHLTLKFGRSLKFRRRGNNGAISQAIERLGHLTYLRMYGRSLEAISVTSLSLKILTTYGSSSLCGLRIGALSCPMLKHLTCSGIHTMRPSCILGYAESLETLKLHYLDWREEDEHIELERINEMSEAIQRLPELRSISIMDFSVVSSLQLLYDSLEFLESRGCKVTLNI